MPNYVKGNINSESRILVFDDTNMNIEASEVFLAGEWFLEVTNTNKKLVVAREIDSGNAFGYGYVTPAYEASLLAINSNGDTLAINSVGDELIVSI